VSKASDENIIRRMTLCVGYQRVKTVKQIIWNLLFFNSNKRYIKTQQCYVIRTLGILLYFFIENWTKTPVPAAHVNSWSDSLRSATCSGEADYKLWIN